MRLCRFKVGGKERFGIYSEGEIRGIKGNLFSPGKETGKTYREDEVEFLPPTQPTKIACIGFNFMKHRDELKDIATDEPTITLLAANSVTGHNRDILLPEISKRVDHEAELGVVIGKRGYRIEKPKEHILGYTIVNDVTARDIEHEMVQWSPSKSFPGFCPVGPCINTELDARNLRIQCRVNDEVRQDSRTGGMIYSPEECVRFVSKFMILERGDLIATGTVPGIGRLEDGDVVEVEIDGIGVLRNFMKKE